MSGVKGKSGVYKKTEKHKRKISQSMRGGNQTSFKKGFTPWNKGKKYFQIIGNKHPNWKGGQRKFRGYIYLRNPNHPFCNKNGYIRRSRIVMEQILKRYLMSTEIVHHINKIITDDRPENLMLFSNHREHRIFHYLTPVK